MNAASSPPQPRPCWHLVVVGRADGWDAVALVRRLDAAVACALGRYQPVIVAPPNGPAHAWAQQRCYGQILVPALGRAFDRDRELVGWADAVLVFGDPAPWLGLYAQADAKGVPIHFARQPPVRALALRR